MKKFRRLAAVTTIGVLFLLSAKAGVQTVNSIAVVHFHHITPGDIINYLEQRGYTVVSNPVPVDGEGHHSWECRTSKNGVNYVTTVYVEGDSIVGHTDEIVD